MKYATRNTIRVIILALVFICAVAFCAQAADEIFTGKVERITMKTTKTGEGYSILFVQETKELEGVSYTVSTPFYAFGGPSETARGLKPGDQFRAVVNKSERGGNTRYSILGFAK